MKSRNETLARRPRYRGRQPTSPHTQYRLAFTNTPNTSNYISNFQLRTSILSLFLWPAFGGPSFFLSLSLYIFIYLYKYICIYKDLHTCFGIPVGLPVELSRSLARFRRHFKPSGYLSATFRRIQLLWDDNSLYPAAQGRHFDVSCCPGTKLRPVLLPWDDIST